MCKSQLWALGVTRLPAVIPYHWSKWPRMLYCRFKITPTAKEQNKERRETHWYPRSLLCCPLTRTQLMSSSRQTVPASLGTRRGRTASVSGKPASRGIESHQAVPPPRPLNHSQIQMHLKTMLTWALVLQCWGRTILQSSCPRPLPSELYGNGKNRDH